MSSLANKPTLIETEDKKLRFLILDAPSDSNILLYVKEFQKHGVTHLVRVCQDTYNKEPVERANISVHDWPFEDGCAPPNTIIKNWLELVAKIFPHVLKPSIKVDDPSKLPCVAVHCVAGLGRAPLLVAIALIEFAGMTPLDAITFIRKKRKGAINAKQVTFIEHYKPKNKKMKSGECSVM